VAGPAAHAIGNEGNVPSVPRFRVFQGSDVYSEAMPPRIEQALESIKEKHKELEDKFDSFVKNYESPAKAFQKWLWRKKRAIALWAGGVIVGLATIGAFVAPYIESYTNRWVDNRADDKLKQPIGDINAIRSDVSGIKARLDELSPLIHDWIRSQLQKSSQLSPTEFRQNLPQIAKTIEAAKTQKVDTPQPVLWAVNTKFAGIPKSGPVPWEEELQILSYRFIFNAILAPVPSTRFQGNGKAAFAEIGEGTRPLFKGIVIGRFDQALDGGIWDDMVFVDCTIRYKGGPVTLRNVRFINCRFIFDQVPPAKKLSDELLVSANVSVDIKGS
jgi:hypothetical protein